MTKFKEWPNESIDLLVGGTPCQSFSVAGLRKGLDDPRGNLMLTYGAIARHYQPRWLVWENVPGALSSNGGRDFGAFLWMLAQCGYGWAYRVLDSQYFGVAQRRRRVFVVGYRGDMQRPASVLFKSTGSGRNTAPTKLKGDVTWWNGNAVSQTLDAVLYKGQMMPEKNRFPVLALGEKLCSAETATKTEIARVAELTTPSVTVLDRLRKNGMSTSLERTAQCGRVVLRRVMPIEAERLMGFPDNYTNIPWRKKPEAPDGPRYKALGNSMAVPCMAWIGRRIDEVETLARGGGA
jgi:DNA (cytosine-5)-methyltransferase 1